MPIYNTNAAYLHFAIKSVLSQTYKNFEFLILNDSPDNNDLDTIVATYKDDRIHYFKSDKNRGVAGAYNDLINKATGEYIAIMNHDDIALPKRLEKQVAYLDTHPEVGLLGTGCKKFGSFWRFYRFDSVIMPKADKEIVAMFGFKSPIVHPTIMFRKSILDEHNIKYHENYVSLNDRLFYMNMSQYCKLANLDEILYKYRFHDKMTSRVQKNQIEAEQRVFKIQWLAANDIHLSDDELLVYFGYLTKGRARIRDKKTLKTIQTILEKLDAANQEKGFLDKETFHNICGKYLTKRCMNAAVWGRISAKDIIATTTLPIHKTWLFKLNQALLGWKK